VVEARRAQLDCLESRLGGEAASPAVWSQLAELRQHLETRAGLPAARWRRLVPVLSGLVRGRYQQFDRGLPSAGLDLLRAAR
jgi:hypothetical protein